MAENSPVVKEEQPRSDVPTPDGVSSASVGRPLMAKLVGVGFVLVLVVTECLAAYFLFPSASQTAAMVNPAPASEAKGEAPAKAHQKGSKDRKDSKAAPDQVEVDLGEYSVTASHSAANTTLQITFRLYGTIDAMDESEFQELKKESEHRFREQVLVAVRGANLSDLTDAGLGLLKRNILEKTNKILGKPILQAIIFSDFAFIEQ